jgi:hypothetical protein
MKRGASRKKGQKQNNESKKGSKGKTGNEKEKTGAERIGEEKFTGSSVMLNITSL